MKEPSLTKCCNAPAYADPLCSVVGIKTRFASVARCSNCHRVMGDYKLDWTEDAALKAIQKTFNGTSWAMMLDVINKRVRAPLNFEMGTVGVLVPEGYQGDKKHEADLTNSTEEECPF